METPAKVIKKAKDDLAIDMIQAIETFERETGSKVTGISFLRVVISNRLTADGLQIELADL